MASWADDATRNREAWTRANAEYTAAQAERAWKRNEVTWGLWGVPDAQLGILGDVRGLDVVELGCGTAYFSAWLACEGARPVGVDVTPAQLETARRLMRETGIEFPLIEADAGATGLRDASFDLALSEYGASIWVDCDRWLAEASRLLRPAGRLVFMCGSVLAKLCYDAETDRVGEVLRQPQGALGRIEWPDAVEFQPSHGDWIRALRRHGFAVDDLVEVQAPANAVTHEYYTYVSAEWAQRWPAEEIWVAHKT